MTHDHEIAPVHLGDATHEWCPHCHKSTLARSGIYALSTTGPRRIGEYALCEECGWSPYSE